MMGDEAGLSADGHTQEKACLNCGAALIGSHCHQCGQHAHVHRTLSALGHDLLHGVLHFEGTFWNSAPLLALRPGELTRRYIDGERKRFISPMALFLFAIFLMFVIFSFVGGPFGDMETPEVRTAYGEEAAAFEAQIAEDAAQLKALPPGDPKRETLNDDMKAAMSGRNALAVMRGEPMPYAGAGYLNGTSVKGASDGTFDVNTGSPALDRLVTAFTHKVQTNPSLILYKMKSNGYKFAWLLIPLSLPFVWLVTLGAKGSRFYDHAIFTTYSLSFMVLLFLTLTLLGRIGLDSGILLAVGMLIPPVHLYKQLRHSYRFSRPGTVVRLSVLLILIPLIGLIFTFLLLALGLAG